MAAKATEQEHLSEDEIVDLRPRPRYVPDYTAPMIDIPIPTQVCFYLGQKDKMRDARTMKLVQIDSVGPARHIDDLHIHDVIFTVLNTDDGHPTAKRFTLPSSAELRDKLRIPNFVAAIDRWASVPDPRPAYADVLDVFEHGFGLINAKYLDLKQEMANLNATLARLAANQNELTVALRQITIPLKRETGSGEKSKAGEPKS